jgi:hypothetical protein
MHSQKALLEYNQLKSSNNLPSKWNVNEHLDEVESTDYGMINFIETKGLLPKVCP